MSSKKKFGAFAGVFTPSILTILGVIMYMRMGWVVGNAGLIGTIIIVLIAHVIAISTGLSVSSIATDKKIGAGGIYYVLSRSMGIPLGGSIGIALYVGTAFSIALYLIGFAESVNGYFGFGTSINDLRITGTIALVSITVLALISTSFALKAQFFILAAIIISLVSIFFGTNEFAPQTVRMFSGEGSARLELVFAIFFPAVTGFTAGIAMSGDLKDPKRSIPIGTLLAIGTGMVVYISLAVFLSFTINSDLLKSDYNILMRVAFYAPAVVAGIWGATLSSALGGILGGPRILQAMSLDRITPRIFGKGKGENNEPINALILVFIIAQAGILIGELDVIARVVSMFYLTAYGFINISYFLESWANPDFQPTFKIKRWVGLVGFFACFAVMFKLDMIAMFGAFVVVGALYFWLQRKQIQLQSDDVWQSVWTNIVNKGLRKLEAKERENSNWNPNIILFSGESKHRPYLLELGDTVSGRTGMVTNFKLIVDRDYDNPLPKTDQIVKDTTFEKLGIFSRQVKVKNIFAGIVDIASTFGFSGVEPNTIMMGWPRGLNDAEEAYSKMTQTLLRLDYNLLYLDFDLEAKFGKYRTVDLWWRETDGKNAEMMLNIARFITESPKWNNTKIRVLFANNNNIENNIIKTKIAKLVEDLRVDVEIKIINNGVEQKPFYDLIALQSASTDLTLVGIPNYKIEKQAEFVVKTTNLFETIGSTLLVRAANNFNELELDFVRGETYAPKKLDALQPLAVSKYREINDAVFRFDLHLSESNKRLSRSAFKPLSSAYFQFIEDAQLRFERTLDAIKKDHSVNRVAREIQVFSHHLAISSDKFKNKTLPEIEASFGVAIESYLFRRKEFVAKAPRKIKYSSPDSKSEGIFGKQINWRKTLEYSYSSRIFPNVERAFLEFGVQNFLILTQMAERVKEEAHLFIEKIGRDQGSRNEAFIGFRASIRELFEELLSKCKSLEADPINKLNTFERELCTKLAERVEHGEFFKKLKTESKNLGGKLINQTEENIAEYASIWHRNQTFAHNQLQSDFNLSNAGLSVFMINEIIKSRINRLTIVPQQHEIELFTDSIDHISKQLDAEKLENYNDKTIDKLIEGGHRVDFNQILKNEEDRILSISGKAPEQVSLLSAESFNEFKNHQNEHFEAINVSLANIQNYIIRSSYLYPLQNSLRSLERVFEENAEELYVSSNLVRHILSQVASGENTSEYERNLMKAKSRAAKCLADLEKIEASTSYDLGVHIHDTLTNLDIRAIIESIDSYSRVSLKPIIKTRFQDWYDKQRESLNLKYNKLYRFILKQKRDADSLKFIEKHNQYLNSVEMTNKFMSALSLDAGAERDLSFYYKKLFTGSHLGNIDPLYIDNELNAAKRAIKKIDGDVSGAIMVLGESNAGKTIFIETISNTLLGAEKVHVLPPAKQNFDVNDVHTAFRNSFHKTGTARYILNQIERKSVIIIDDIEKWWVKSPKGNEAINYLVRLIEKFGKKHYFLLSCNRFSFDIIRQISMFEEQLLATIIVPPVSKPELKEILMNRHRTAGADIYFNKRKIGEAKKIDTIINEIHHKSKGNVGTALGAWIGSIKKDKSNRLIIKKPKPICFPDIENPKWKALLYHLVIHGGLKEGQAKEIFGEAEWVFRTIKEIEKTGLISKKSNAKYVLNTSAKHYVEEWLKEQKILN